MPTRRNSPGIFPVERQGQMIGPVLSETEGSGGVPPE